MNKLTSIIENIKYNYLRPNQIYESIFDIDFGQLYDDGIRSLLIDIDNTLISYTEDNPSLQCINLFNKVKTYGFDSIILLSNHSSTQRVGQVAKQLDIPGVAFSCKPFIFTARRIMKNHNMTAKTTAMIGDQLLTDVLLGSFLNLTTIFVDPIDAKNVSFLKKNQYRFQQIILNSF